MRSKSCILSQEDTTDLLWVPLMQSKKKGMNVTVKIMAFFRLTAMFPINHSNGTVNEGGVNPFKVRVGEDTVSWKVGEVRNIKFKAIF